MQPLTTTEGQGGLPRYFAPVFATACAMEAGRLDFVLPDGRRFRAEGRARARRRARTSTTPTVFARLIREGDLGFSEAYIEGGWSTPDLQAFMDLVHVAGDDLYDGFPGRASCACIERLRYALRGNSRRQARRNIAAHYDLGNDFYRLWLDETMTYSSAASSTGQESLEAAQTAKYASLVDQMGVAPGRPCARDRLRLGRLRRIRRGASGACASPA